MIFKRLQNKLTNKFSTFKFTTYNYHLSTTDYQLFFSNLFHKCLFSIVKKYKRFRNINIFLIFPFIFMLYGNSCRMSYSFTGADIPIEAKTFSVKYFQNNATLVQPMLSQKITEALQERMLRQTNLNMVNSGGDLIFEGEITAYNIMPVAIHGNETAQLTQLNVTINVRYFNNLDTEKNFETSFTRYQQFSASLNLSAVEERLIDIITEELIDDVFNRALVNW